MKTKKFAICADLCNLIQFFLIIIAGDAALVCGMESKLTLMDYLVIGGTIVFSYAIRAVIRKVIPFFLMNIAYFIIIFNLPYTDEMVAVKIGIYAIVSIVANIRYWTTEDAPVVSDINLANIIVILISYVYCYRKQSYDVAQMLYIFAVVFVACHALKIFCKNAYDMAAMGQLGKNSPVREMFKNNFILVSGITIVSVLSMLFFSANNLIAFLDYIGDVVWNFIRRILALIIGNEVEEDAKVMHTHTEFPVIEMEGEELPLVWLWRVLEAILVLSLICVMLYIMVQLLMSFFRNNWTKEKAARKNYTLTVKNEVRERITRINRADDTRSGFFRNNSEKIRFMYRKKLMGFKKSGVGISNTNTPDENRLLVNSAKNINLSESTAIYEKVRYNTKYEPTKKDVDLMKKVIKGN